VLELSTDPAVKERILAFMFNMRRGLKIWLRDLLSIRQQQLRQEATEESRQQEADTMLRITQLCATIRSTFNVDLEILTVLFQIRENLATFLECGFLMRKHTSPSRDNLSSVLHLLLERDQVLAISTMTMQLMWQFLTPIDSGLSEAVRTIWQDFTASTLWRRINHYWLSTITSSDMNSRPRTVYVNLVDGQLLIDGRSSGILPPSITGDPTFKWLFPSIVCAFAI
jgi:hypothetical protein